MILTQCNKSNKKQQGFKHNHKNKHNNYTICNKSVHSKTDNKYRTKNRRWWWASSAWRVERHAADEWM